MHSKMRDDWQLKLMSMRVRLNCDSVRRTADGSVVGRFSGSLPSGALATSLQSSPSLTFNGAVDGPLMRSFSQGREVYVCEIRIFVFSVSIGRSNPRAI